jgi:hypoxanthine phosphoribosyltransferase
MATPAPPKYSRPYGAGSLPVLINRDAIGARVAELGAQVDSDLAGESVLLVGVLKGAAIFLADLARAISIHCTFDFVAVSSYGKGTRSSGAVKLIKDLDHPIEDRNIILVEDILDTGLTLAFLKRMLAQHRPRSLRVAALLDKPERRLEAIQAEYVGFRIPNHFVVGYGMDYAERYRNLPDICIFPPDAAE